MIIYSTIINFYMTTIRMNIKFNLVTLETKSKQIVKVNRVPISNVKKIVIGILLSFVKAL